MHCRQTDTELLIQTVKKSADLDIAVRAAIHRLEECHAKGLRDYLVPEAVRPKKQRLYKMAKYQGEFVGLLDARETEAGWEYDIRKQDGTELLMIHEFDLSEFCL